MEFDDVMASAKAAFPNRVAQLRTCEHRFANFRTGFHGYEKAVGHPLNNLHTRIFRHTARLHPTVHSPSQP